MSCFTYCKVLFDEYQAIVYGGWIMAGNAVKVKWFLNKADSWNDKKLAVLFVSAKMPEDK